MKELREHNENMLRNILPSHVARHFLEKDRDNEVSPGLSSWEEQWWWEGCSWTHWSRALGESPCPCMSPGEWRPCYPRVPGHPDCLAP